MLLTDKELALKLLGFAEDLIIQSSAHQLLLNQHVPNWQDEYQAILGRCGTETKQLVHERLESMWTQIFEAPDVSSVVKDLLKDIPEIDPQ